MSHRDELLRILVERSLQKGDFTLASGQKSTYYINGKLTSLDSRGAYLTARIFLAMLADDVPEAVGGLTLGADGVGQCPKNPLDLSGKLRAGDSETVARLHDVLGLNKDGGSAR